LLHPAAAARVLNLLEKLGFKLFADELLNADNANLPTLLSGLEEFREHLGGELSITLLSEIGRGVEIHEMNPRAIAAAVAELRARAGK
jgi:3-dehydroquinate synthase